MSARNSPLKEPKRILITGASSGIGAALAEAYAAPGVTLHPGGRDATRLEAVTQACRAKGAAVEPHILDVTERDGMAAWIAGAAGQGRLDLVIANAGISGGTGFADGGENEAAPSASQAEVERILAVNVAGVVNTVFPAISAMRRQDAESGIRGQIAIMSSLAGFRGLPGAPAYAASKACVRSLSEGLRGLCSRDGIRVSAICPGFVRSPMTDVNPYPMPFLMDADRAALIVKHGLARDRARIAFPWRLWAMVWLMTALPVGLTDPLFRRMPEKPEGER